MCNSIYFLLILLNSEIIFRNKYAANSILINPEKANEIDAYTLRNITILEHNIHSKDIDPHLDTFKDPLFKDFKTDKLKHLLRNPIERPNFLIDKIFNSSEKNHTFNKTYDQSRNISISHRPTHKNISDNDFSINTKNFERDDCNISSVSNAISSSSLFFATTFGLLSDFSSLLSSSTANISPACNLCPTLFVVDTFQDCRSTFGIVPTTRGFAAVTYFTLNYTASCSNNQPLTSDQLKSLADLEIIQIEDTARNFPEQYNIANTMIYKVDPNSSSFTLLFKLYINSFPLLFSLVTNLRSIASKNLNTTFCLANYSITSAFFEDIDECALGLDTCLSDQICLNIVGTFICSCNVGFVFNNITCQCDKVDCPPKENLQCLSFNGDNFYFPIPSEKSFKVIFIPTIAIFGLLILTLLGLLQLQIKPKEQQSSSDYSSLSV